MDVMFCLVILVYVILNRGYSFIVPGCIISGMAIIIFLFLVVGEFSPFSCLQGSQKVFTLVHTGYGDRSPLVVLQ